jgi:cellulose synthase/poly-beta-1,6-N-acetylglucosamine synthase-like glycosyltransferase
MWENVASAASCLFWCCLGLTFYTYAGYPAFVWLLARSRRSVDRPTSSSTGLPIVTLLVAAHNEEDVIERKIENSLGLDYPTDRLRVVIGSDGSTDATPAIVAKYAERGVRLLEYRTRRGKSAVLNSAFCEIDDDDIVVLSDANTDYDRAAIRNLVRWFEDPGVDAVCGRLVLRDPVRGDNVDGLYWRYETFIKMCEGRLGALLGANGGIYAIRRQAFMPIPDNTIVDDFVIPLLSKLRHGGRIIYEPDAVAVEECPPTIGNEFRRRIRIGTGAYQSLVLLWPLLSPRHGWTAFAFFSHKVLRWLAPLLLLGMLVANGLLLDQAAYRFLLAAQLTGYTAAIAGMFLKGGSFPEKIMRSFTMFVGMNVALFVGFFHWIGAKQTGVWRRTARTTGQAMDWRPEGPHGGATMQPSTAQEFSKD